MKDDKKITMASIDALMEEMREVVVRGRELKVDDVFMLTYILEELKYVFKKGESDVQMSEMWNGL